MTTIDYLSPVKDEWYIRLIEDLQDIVVERTFNANWEKVLGKHEIGRRIFDDHHNFERKYIYGKDIATELAKSLNCSARDINRCIQFFRKYPNLNLLPAGKNISWNKIIKEFLPNKKGEENDKDKSIQGDANREKIDRQGTNTKYSIPFSSPDLYKEFVQSQPCCVCNHPPPSSFAHFPITRARKDEHWGIPLCLACHRQQEDGGAGWMWEYRRKWAGFLFGLLLNAK